MEFGYLPKSDIETGNLRTEEQFRNAIKDLQKYAHIPVTGNLDDRTKDLLKRPRCGLPDKADTLDFSPDNLEKSDNRRRRKRYVVQGAKWDHLDLTWR
ncbi:matrix metalloproteinase-2-like [Condylostylus longicornis]|uniref:matrix metalloproteinase-2-like n=1 Tax=Condylostylus longicornis TaxID=2530218 RepID=UPI00244DA5CE|nr:matrix metalloproteinase-2-like [Condylostylus longicornis]